MKKILALAACMAVLAIPEIAAAQAGGDMEIIVTASRKEEDGYDSSIPAVGLRRTADFAVQEVTITGDTRDPEKRAEEIYATLAAALREAPKAGVQLAYGETRLQAITPDNFRTLSLQKDNRPDSQRLVFLAKIPLKAGADSQAAEKRIAAFVKAVPTSGRALLETTDDLTFSVVAPDQYRGAVADAIAADARVMAARLGPDYGVEIEGLNKPVEWTRMGLSDVLLYIPYRLVIVPRK